MSKPLGVLDEDLAALYDEGVQHVVKCEIKRHVASIGTMGLVHYPTRQVDYLGHEQFARLDGGELFDELRAKVVHDRRVPLVHLGHALLEMIQQLVVGVHSLRYLVVLYLKDGEHGVGQHIENLVVAKSFGVNKRRHVRGVCNGRM